MTDSILKTQDLKVAFGETKILQGISIDFEKGSTTGIIGPNGSGKTTFFNAISGFVPSTGKITFQDKEVQNLPPEKRARLGFGRVFQNTGIFKTLTVQENIQIALEAKMPLLSSLHPFSKVAKDAKENSLQFLEMVSLSQKAKDKAASLSGGQMRLLEIARTIALGAEIILLDEPTAGVSPKMKEDLVVLIRRLQDLGKTILVIEHDIDFIYSFCNRIVVLESGTVFLDGRPEEVIKDDRLKEIYLGKGVAA